MKYIYLAVALAMCWTPITNVIACEKEYTKKHFELDGHHYFTVTGYCSGEITYTLHSENCPCGRGVYEVKIES